MKRTIALLSVLLIGVGSAMALDFPVQGLITSDGVRVRSEAGVSGAVVAKLNHGVFCEVEAQSDESTALAPDGEKNWWYQVRLDDGRRGWVYGAFVDFSYSDLYPESDEESRIYTFTLKSAGPAKFSASVYGDMPDQGDEEPMYDNHLMIVVDDGSRKPVIFVRMSDESLFEKARSVSNDDAWYLLVSGMGGEQSLVGAEVESAHELRFHVREQGNGGSVFDIYLLCVYNSAARSFDVESVDIERRDLEGEDGAEDGTESDESE